MIKHGAKFTVTDDSHCAEFVGSCYSAVRQYLLDNGIKELYRLKRAADGNGPNSVTLESVPLTDLLPHKSWCSFAV